MPRYAQGAGARLTRCVLMWLNGLFPFLHPMRGMFRHWSYVRGPLLFLRDYFHFSRRQSDPRFPLRFLDVYPCLFDRFDQAGGKPRHYFHQDLWAAKKVYASKTTEHVDLGSRIDGFVAHCAVFCRVTVFDVRPLEDLDANIRFVQASMTDLTNIPDGSIHSLSSLHVFEHLGLGRYGDPLGSQYLDKAASEAVRILAPGGHFYFSVPIGAQRLEFNAHRVFAPETVISLFQDLELIEFSAVDDQDDLIHNPDPADFHEAQYSCGLFHFKKTAPAT